MANLDVRRYVVVLVPEVGFERIDVSGGQVCPRNMEALGGFPRQGTEICSWYLCDRHLDATAGGMDPLGYRVEGPTDFVCPKCVERPSAALICECGVVSPAETEGQPRCLWCGRKPSAGDHACRETSPSIRIYFTADRCPLCDFKTPEEIEGHLAPVEAPKELPPVEALVEEQANRPPVPRSHTQKDRSVQVTERKPMEAIPPPPREVAKPKLEPKEHGRRLIILGALGAIAVAVIVFYSLLGRAPDNPMSAPPIAQSMGILRVTVSPAARASLEGWQAPDEGEGH